MSFGPASKNEHIVFGSQMPGYGARSIPETVVKRWISFMKDMGIRRVCSLLAQSQLGYYLVDLLEIYKRAFGEDHVLHVPIEDYCLCDKEQLRKILLFLKESDTRKEPVVVHCAGGRGRTGFVHAAWLVQGRGFSVEEALETVKAMGRNPLEAVERGNASIDELYVLISQRLI
ncbi:MAG TPA: dual specificity protein phosphatase family protein [Syntrophorhabdaceae bacterium]|nr:dual specificity protein phosphatase family protein [Syntrophorhabdaceae bacterium]